MTIKNVDQPISLQPPSLGENLRWLRKRKDWNLNRLAKESGLPQSTLSKVEHGQMSLNYEKLLQVAKALDVNVALLFEDEKARNAAPVATARRTIQRASSAPMGRDEQYEFLHLCTELKNRLMVPIFLRVHDRGTVDDAESPYSVSLQHIVGERFAYVLSGRVQFLTEEYETVELETGDSLYVDAAMPHAFVARPGETADILAVVTSDDPEYLEFVRHRAAQQHPDASRAYEEYRRKVQGIEKG